MIGYSEFIKLKNMLVGLFLKHYSSTERARLIDDPWALVSVLPKRMPVWHWHDSYFQFEICSLDYNLRTDVWRADLLHITSKLSAVVMSGKRGDRAFSPQLYVYKHFRDEAIPLQGTSFKDLPWYYIAKLVWNKWQWMIINAVLLALGYLVVWQFLK
jgi:hypothetical protein